MASDMDMPMTMPTGGTTMKMDMDDDYKMWMWFHTEINDTILFQAWHVKTAGMMVLACVLVFFLGVIYELVKYLRVVAEKALSAGHRGGDSYLSKLFSGHHVLQTLIFCAQTLIGYILMLVFMNFSVWICIAVVIGATVGFYLFSSRAHA